MNYEIVPPNVAEAWMYAGWQAHEAAENHARPSAVYRPTLTRDGNEWCALYGENLATGCAGFGETPEQAMFEFDKAWKGLRSVEEGET